MFPTICRCCGGRIAGFIPPNCNLCVSCALGEEDPGWCAEQSKEESPAQVIQMVDSSDEFLSPEGPSVLECLEALQDAERAIAEATTHQPPSEPGNKRIFTSQA